MAQKPVPHYWPFVKGIHWWQAFSNHKDAVIPSFKAPVAVNLNKVLDKQSSFLWSETSWLKWCHKICCLVDLLRQYCELWIATNVSLTDTWCKARNLITYRNFNWTVNVSCNYKLGYMLYDRMEDQNLLQILKSSSNQPLNTFMWFTYVDFYALW